MEEKDGKEKEKESGAAKVKAGAKGRSDIRGTASIAARKPIRQQNAEAQPRQILSNNKSKDKKQKETATGAGSKWLEEVAGT